jgi:hypothetical protein
METGFEEIRELFKESDRKLKEVGRQLGRFGNEAGFFVQELVKPGLVRLLRERGIDVDRTHSNLEVSRRKPGGAMEIDLLACNGDQVVVVEVKKKLKTEDVEEHVERLDRFRAAFPEYDSHELYGAVAGMSVPDNAASYAERRGLFVIAPSGDDVTLLNSPGFSPRRW